MNYQIRSDRILIKRNKIVISKYLRKRVINSANVGHRGIEKRITTLLRS